MDKSRYHKILNQLVKDSFPKLKKDKIYLMRMYLWKFTGAASRLPFNKWLICFHPKIKKWEEKPIKGVFAHELCHFENYKRDGWIKNFLLGFTYFISPNLRRKIERKTDKLTIEKGYAKELYEAAEKRLYKNTKTESYYLSPKEIEKYAKSIGKW